MTENVIHYTLSQINGNSEKNQYKINSANKNKIKIGNKNDYNSKDCSLIIFTRRKTNEKWLSPSKLWDEVRNGSKIRWK